MSLDISDILQEWPFEPGQLNVRKIRGKDGEEKIQLRLDLGLLQMETSGRPDGQRPHGFESLLEYYEDKLEKHRRTKGADRDFHLSEYDCELLRAEGVMYYHRYLAAFVLEDYRTVIQDTSRNLCLFDFCREYAREEPDRTVMERYRPYVLMMRARARAHLAIDEGQPESALTAVRNGIEKIERFIEDFCDGPSPFTGELDILQSMEKDIEDRTPTDPIRQIRRDLNRAVREERYEEAARLHDQLEGLIGRQNPRL